MASATETCSCGASVEVTTRHERNLAPQLAAWRTGHRHLTPTRPCPETERHLEAVDGR